MSHELEIIDGKASVFSVNQPMWHGLGEIITEAPSIDKAVEIARAGYEVGLKPLYTAQHDLEGHALEIDERVSHRATYRKDNGAILGIVGPKYSVIQNADALKAAMGPFLDAGLLSLETGGVLRDGQRCWFQARINVDPEDVVDGDTVEAYALLANSHDGVMATRWGFTPQRVVCNNTLSFAIGSRDSQLVKVMHRGDVAKSLEALSEVMDLAKREFAASVDQYRQLARTSCSAEDLERYVRRVFTPDKDQEDAKAAKVTIPKIVRLFEEGRGSAIDGVRGTAWGAYNAVNEYLGYERGSDQAVRVDSMWFGDSATLNRRALQEALQIAA